MSQQQIETREIFTPETRARIQVREDGKKTVVGYGAVFYREGVEGTVYRMFDDLEERIGREAVDRAIKERQDVRGLVNHDKNQLLGRTTSGTLALSVDEVGLRYEIELPDTQAGRDVAVSLERGDLDGSSFAMIPKRVSWIEEDDKVIRQVEDVDLYDVGPVTYRAYAGTSSAIRSSEDVSDIREQADRIIEERKRKADEVAVSLKMLELD